MQVLLAIVTHALLLGSMVAFLVAAIAAVRDTRNRVEKLLRAGAAFAGALVVLGANAAGVTFAQFIVDSLSGSSMMGNGAKVVSAVVPSALGVMVGMYFLRAIRKDTNRALRVFAFIGTLAAVQFAQIYAAAVDTRGLDVGAAAIPNISFVVAILLYAGLKYDNKPHSGPDASKIAAFARKFTSGKVPGFQDSSQNPPQYSALDAETVAGFRPAGTGTVGFSAPGSRATVAGSDPFGAPATSTPPHHGPSMSGPEYAPRLEGAAGSGRGPASSPPLRPERPGEGPDEGLLRLRRR